MRTIVNKWNLSAKKRLACLAAVLICAALCACAGDAGQKKNTGTGLQSRASPLRRRETVRWNCAVTTL